MTAGGWLWLHAWLDNSWGTPKSVSGKVFLGRFNQERRSTLNMHSIAPRVGSSAGFKKKRGDSQPRASAPWPTQMWGSSATDSGSHESLPSCDRLCPQTSHNKAALLSCLLSEQWEIVNTGSVLSCSASKSWDCARGKSYKAGLKKIKNELRCAVWFITRDKRTAVSSAFVKQAICAAHTVGWLCYLHFQSQVS